MLKLNVICQTPLVTTSNIWNFLTICMVIFDIHVSSLMDIICVFEKLANNRFMLSKQETMRMRCHNGKVQHSESL